MALVHARSVAFEATLEEGPAGIGRLTVVSTGVRASDSDGPPFARFLEQVVAVSIGHVAIFDLRRLAIPSVSLVRELAEICKRHADVLAGMQIAVAILLTDNLWSLAARRMIDTFMVMVPPKCPLLICHSIDSANAFFDACIPAKDFPASQDTSQVDDEIISNHTVRQAMFASIDAISVADASAISDACVVDMEEVDADSLLLRQAGIDPVSDERALQVVAVFSDAGIVKPKVSVSSTIAMDSWQHSLPNQLHPVRTAYGGDFPWVGPTYKLEVTGGLLPLKWMNRLTQRLLSLGEICFADDGCFQKPGLKEMLPSFGGVSLWWRWDAKLDCVIIDFVVKDRALSWRWDELRQMESSRRAPSFLCHGHVGASTFQYTLTALLDMPALAAL